MNNLEKEALFFEISAINDNKADFNTLGKQSLQITLPCGCKQTQNMFCGKPSGSKENPNYGLWQSVRFQFFEFCNQHINLSYN